MTTLHRKENSELVTPELAKQWLERNNNIRPINEARVARYAHLMERGEWVQDHFDPIMFDCDGKLRNGQNRLAAIIRSGQPIRMRVALNVSEAEISASDSGWTRGDADVVKIFDERRRNRKLFSTLRILCAQDAGSWKSFYPATLEEQKQRYLKSPEAFDLVVKSLTSARGLENQHVMAELVNYFERNAKGCRDSVRSLITPDGEVQQARMLRDALLQLVNKRGSTFDDKRVGFTIQACLYHEAGLKLQVLRICNWKSDIRKLPEAV